MNIKISNEAINQCKQSGELYAAAVLYLNGCLDEFKSSEQNKTKNNWLFKDYSTILHKLLVEFRDRKNKFVSYDLYTEPLSQVAAAFSAYKTKMLKHALNEKYEAPSVLTPNNKPRSISVNNEKILNSLNMDSPTDTFKPFIIKYTESGEDKYHVKFIER